MANANDSSGYNKGRMDGFLKGKEDGYRKGREDAKALIEQPPLNEISKKWRERQLSDKFADHFGHPVTLVDDRMECLKDTVKSTIWKLEILVNGIAHPVILKIFKAPVAGQDLIELNMYRKANDLLSDLMPAIYATEQSNDHDTWVFMEYVPQLKGQIIFTPDYFDKIIPSLAKLHSRTYNDRFYDRWETFAGWLPLYQSDEKVKERQTTQRQTLEYLDKAMERPDLKIRVESSYKRLQIVLNKGPEYFRELVQAGKSIIHNDLQTPNIGCGNVGEADWNIKFIDWEGARFAPCWFDMFNLIGVFFAYRKDWRNDEEAVIRRCAHLYAEEMGKYGIAFQEDPVRLYKMAYLQRILERSLFLQLQWAVEGQKPAYLLEGYLEKIEDWGKELGLT